MENLVALELNRRYRPDQEEPRVFYHSHGVEVDFVIPEEQLAIQVCADLSDLVTREREVKALQKFLSGIPGKGYRGLILTLDVATGEERNIGGLEVKPVYEWLLGYL